MPEAGSELPASERPLWPEPGARFGTGERQGSGCVWGGANPVLCLPAGLGGTSAGAAAPISFNEALQYFQTADLSECRVRAGPRALALSRGVVLVSRRGERGGRSTALPSFPSAFPRLGSSRAPGSPAGFSPARFPRGTGPDRFFARFLLRRRRSGRRRAGEAWLLWFASFSALLGSSRSCRESGSWLWPWRSVSVPKASRRPGQRRLYRESFVGSDSRGGSGV